MTSPDIARLVDTARRAAAAGQHAFVGTEHLLAAALAQPDGPAVRALAAAGVSLDGFVEELLTGLPRAEPGAGDQPPAPPPLSRFAERAVAEAEQAGGDLAGVLLRSPKGRIASVLSRRGAKLPELRKALEPPRPKGEAKGREPAKRPESGSARSGARPAAREVRATAPPVPSVPPSERRLPPHLEPKPRQSGLGRIPWRLLLLLALPASLLLRWQQGAPLWIFLTACLAMLPLAGLMGDATEQLAERTGPTVGGLLNATFGNAAELIIALVALRAGLVDLVKASITGSILGNLLLILGLSLLAGGLRAPLLRFNRTAAGMSAAMLALATAGLAFPALFHFVHPGTASATLALSELQLSEVVAVILALTYAASLLFSLRTHRALFGIDPTATPQGPEWSALKAVLVLALATAGVVVASELLVGVVEPVTHALGLSQTFLGLILIPVIGNAAEHATAVTVARKGKLDLSLQIALGSSTQVALLIAPLLVVAGVLLGQPLSLLFTPLEVVALGISTVVVAIITLDGESHWFEGVQLLALFAMVAA
ncbi:MAG TPA: calcium/proton exchanger, partial [Gemmatimonadales bacterium]|nr:calcium/proton exchanger [Gemmatimonadales bacterium]